MTVDFEELIDVEGEPAIISGRSYLVVDYGHSAAKATLYDLVDGSYRMIGRGEGLNTAGPPWFDLTYGLQQAIGQIADATGRNLLSSQGQLIRPMRTDGSGVDYFGAAVSLGDPLKVMVAGLLESASIASARKALQAVYAREVGCLSLDDGLAMPAQVEAILVQQPDVLLLVGGTDGGADKQMRRLLRTIALALEIQAEAVRPVVIYGGNASLREAVVETLGELAEVHLAENVRPAYERENIDHTIALLAQVYYALKVESLGSSGVLADWSNSAPILTAHAFGGIAEYLATAGKGRVLGVDVGSGQVTLVSAVEGSVDLLVRVDKGLGRPLRNQLFADNGNLPPKSARSLEGPLADYILDKSAHPYLIPQSARDAGFELTLASRLIGQVVTEAAVAWRWPSDGFAPACHTLLVRGRALTNAANGEKALLALLDGLKPRGVFRLVADAHGILPAMGLLAGDDPGMVVQVLGGYDMAPWGWVVSPVGRARASGQPAVTVSLNHHSGAAVEAGVSSGEAKFLPMAHGQRYEITLNPAPNVDVGAGPGQSRRFEAGGSTLGLAIDGRRC
jgi:hypothetical protein